MREKSEVVYISYDEALDLVDRIADRTEAFNHTMTKNEKEAMADRKEYFKMLNLVNERYHELVIELTKKNANKAHFERLRAIRKQHEEKLRLEFMDDLDKLNQGKEIVFKKVG